MQSAATAAIARRPRERRRAAGRRRLASGREREKTASVSAQVLVYTTGYCPYCYQAKRLLNKKRAPFTEIEVDDRPELRSWLRSASGQTTVPQVFINGVSVGGYTDIAALDGEGELDRLLAEPPSATDPTPPR